MLLLNRTLLKLARGLWRWITATAVIYFLILVGTTALSEIIGGYLGSLFQPEAMLDRTRQAVIWALIAAGLTFLAQLLKGVLSYKTAAKARTALRWKIFSKVMALDIPGIEEIGSVSAMTASVDAVEQIQTYYSVYLPTLIFSLMAPVYLFFHLKNYSLTAAVILLTVAFVLLPLNNLFRSKIENLRGGYWQALEDMTAYYLDSLRGLTTLKLFDRSKEHAQVLGEKAEVLNQKINHFQRINFTSFLITEILMYGSIVVVLIDITCRLVQGSVGISETLVILMLSYSYFSALRQLMNASHDALTAIAAAGKVEDILKMDTERRIDPLLPKDVENFKGIRLAEVSYTYTDQRQAVREISLRIPKGSVTALVGLSGCGKSTIAALLMAFCDPQTGRIFIEGQDYCSITAEKIRKNIVMVPQQVSLYSGTIRENLLMAAPETDDDTLMAVLDEVCLGDFVRGAEKGLDMDVGNAGAALSGGQRQKIGIARALLTEADYMIFDEATASVDPESEKEIWSTIDRLAHRRTLIIISHRMASVKNADQIVVLQNGQIIQCGRHEVLMAEDGLYRELVLRQQVMEEAC